MARINALDATIQRVDLRTIAGSTDFSEAAAVIWANAVAASAVDSEQRQQLINQAAVGIVSRARDYFFDAVEVAADVVRAAADTETAAGQEWGIWEAFHKKNVVGPHIKAELGPAMDASKISLRLWVFINSLPQLDRAISDPPTPSIPDGDSFSVYDSRDLVNLLCTVVDGDRVPVGAIAYTYFTRQEHPSLLYIHNLVIAKPFLVRPTRSIAMHFSTASF